ncbi:Lrp/AsnC family transcriptional regulator [Kocuria rosea]|uniref:Lrp/AsnC family transcriptional regulator n=1 Tax=Kocuria rosea TaxID=1275 RepID=UPI00203BB95E|nr:Lrp/AsnC family transcriptional regulator [Kocuria rosea]
MEQNAHRSPHHRTPIEQLDEIDTRLLKLLAADGRASLRGLGAQVGLSGPAVADRVTRLSERGVIRGFGVDIDWARLGMPTLAHIALLTDKTREIARIVAELHTIPFVEEVSIVTGSTDLLVRARIADLTDLHRLLVEHIWPIEGIQKVETTLAVATETVPDFAGNLIDQLDAPGPVGA